MGHHINQDGNFQSDKFPWLPSGLMIVSLKDPEVLRAFARNGMYSESSLPSHKIIVNFAERKAQEFLATFSRVTEDRELGEDIQAVLMDKYGWKAGDIVRA